MHNSNFLTPEQVRLCETAEYDTTVAAARDGTGKLTPDDCLAYALGQYLLAYPHPWHYPDDTPSYVPETDPNYPRLFAEHQEKAKQELARAYALASQRLQQEKADAFARNPPEPLLLLARLLKQSAQRIVRYSEYFADVRTGQPTTSGKPRLAQLRYAAGLNDEGAAELAHFRQLLAEFETEIVTACTQQEVAEHTINQLNKSDDLTSTNERNIHWRIEANYEKDVLPLRIRLESVKWNVVVEWHKPHWKREFVTALSWSHKLGSKGFWQGTFRLKSGRCRLIQRDRILPYSTYRVRLSLPIPDPATLDQREYNTALELWRKVYAVRDERKQKETLIQRKYLADRLIEISQQLGSYDSPLSGYRPQLLYPTKKVGIKTGRIELWGTTPPKAPSSREAMPH